MQFKASLFDSSGSSYFQSKKKIIDHEFCRPIKESTTAKSVYKRSGKIQK